MTTEIEEICDENLKETFFMSPDAANRKCFHGFNCSQYCNVLHPLCGNPDTIEVAMAAFYPFFKKGDEKVRIELHFECDDISFILHVTPAPNQSVATCIQRTP